MTFGYGVYTFDVDGDGHIDVLGAFRYDDVAGRGFASVGIGFFAIAWVFNALKGRV